MRVREMLKLVMRGRGNRAAVSQTLLANVLIQFTNVLTGVVTARALGATGRGELAAIGLWPQFLAYCLTLGIPSSLLYNVKKTPEDADRLFAGSLVIGLVMGAIATLVGIIFVPYWLSEYSPRVIRFSQLFMLTATPGLLGAVFTSALQATGEFSKFNAFRYVPNLVTVAWLWILAIAHRMTPASASLAYMLPSLPITLYAGIFLTRHFRPQFHAIGLPLRRLLIYGITVYGSDLLGTLSLQIDRVLVVGFLSPEQMGVYAVALGASRLLTVFQQSIAAVVLPDTAGRPVREISDKVGKAVRLTGALTLPAALIAAFVAPIALRVLYGKDFGNAVGVFRLLLMEAVIGSVTWILAQTFMAAGKPVLVLVLQGIGLLMSIPLMIVLVPRYGLDGVGMALVGSSLIRFGFAVACYRMVLGISAPRMVISLGEIQSMLAPLWPEKSRELEVAL